MLDESPWEDVVLDLGTGKFQTDKVGYSTFGQVFFAVNLLREFYTVVPGIAALHGNIPLVESCLGWMNYLFHETWDNRRTYRVQEVYRVLPHWSDRCYEDDEDDPAAKELIACMARPYTVSGENDPKILEKMTDDRVATGCTDIEISPVSTLDFLNKASAPSRYFCFAGGMITQDDRAYWWRPKGDVRFSEKMKAWLRDIHEQYGEYLNDEREIDVWNTMRRILTKCTGVFRRPVLFSSFYWECSGNEKDRNVWAAVRQLESVLNDAVRDGDCTWLDRYSAVVANKVLRKRVLGF